MTIEQTVARSPAPNAEEVEAIERIMIDRIRAIDQLPVKSTKSYFLWVAIGCYTYGVMQGKRAERARRKGKAAIGAGTPIAAGDTTQGSECVKCEYTTAARDMEGAAE